jgi:hypothetical protein
MHPRHLCALLLAAFSPGCFAPVEESIGSRALAALDEAGMDEPDIDAEVAGCGDEQEKETKDFPVDVKIRFLVKGLRGPVPQFGDFALKIVPLHNDVEIAKQEIGTTKLELTANQEELTGTIKGTLTATFAVGARPRVVVWAQAHDEQKLIHRDYAVWRLDTTPTGDIEPIAHTLQNLRLHLLDAHNTLKLVLDPKDAAAEATLVDRIGNMDPKGPAFARKGVITFREVVATPVKIKLTPEGYAPMTISLFNLLGPRNDDGSYPTREVPVKLVLPTGPCPAATGT